ncbi:exodeoxyribonuclease III [Corynebacterium ulceribovis]|uniref:exodeoxyribonuclease III n=1 Tax=Corynebacterium ulceribovis TaxID=487732 RepID=UPI00036D26F6|nr:exodeoxyribonuclease III [Corynebacterium ulceribovis]
MALTVTTLNVNGIRAAVKKRSEQNLGMLPWLNDTSADVILLQEVRATNEQAEKALAPALEAGWYWAGADDTITKGHAGVGILSRLPLYDVMVGFGDNEFSATGRYIEAKVDDAGANGGAGDGRTTVASLYLPSGSVDTPKQDEKYRFLELFGDFLAERGKDEDMVIGGDWNICHRQEDLKNWKTNQKKSGFLPDERSWMDSILGTFPDEASQNTGPHEPHTDPHWFDVQRRLQPESLGPYTWWTYRGKAFDTDAGWRIDYHMATASMLARATSVHVDRAAAYDLRWTDHAPVTVVYQ